MGAVREAFGELLDAMGAAGARDAAEGTVDPAERRLWEMAWRALAEEVLATGWSHLTQAQREQSRDDLLPVTPDAEMAQQLREAYLRGAQGAVGGDGSQLYEVEVRRTVSTTVKVRATSPLSAIDTVNDVSYPLPPVQEWDRHKDWVLRVYDSDGNEVGEVER